MGVYIVMGGTPNMDGLVHAKSDLEMDENWRYPHFRKRMETPKWIHMVQNELV